ncbi:MAG: nitrile hydratase subunit beta [Dongiaceae bacterium]
MRQPHDLGGLPGGPVDRSEHDYAHWEKQVDALLVLLGEKGLVRVDELRRNIESLGEAAYSRFGYYERWIEAIAATLLQRGVLTADEIGRKLAAPQAAPQAARGPDAPR